MKAPLVRDASSKSEIKDADRKIERLNERRADDLKTILSTIEGRRWMWNFLGACNLFQSPWADSGSKLAKNVGKQEIAQDLMNEIIAADSDLYLTMQREAYKELKENG